MLNAPLKLPHGFHFKIAIGVTIGLEAFQNCVQMFNREQPDRVYGPVVMNLRKTMRHNEN